MHQESQVQWRNEKLYRKTKAEKIQYHQTSITTNAKGVFLDRKHKRSNRSTKAISKQF